MKLWTFLSEDSLRKQVKNTIKLNHNTIAGAGKNRFVRKGFNFLNDRGNWWLVVGIVFSIFFFFTLAPVDTWVSHINLDLISFVDTKSASQAIDQRTSNIATIISMTLAVTAMLISNLVIKEPFIYQLLYSKSFLNFIIVYTLSTIACLIIVDTLKDSFPKGKEYYFYRGVLCGTYMVITVLVLIGHLFKTLYDFINATSLQQILREELLKEAEAIVVYELLNKYSLIRYKELMSQNGLKEFNFANGYQAGVPVNVLLAINTPADLTEPKFVYDIHLGRIGELLKKTSAIPARFFRNMSLNSVSSIYHRFIYLNTTSEDQQKYSKQYNHCFYLKAESKAKQPDSSFKSYFDQKLAESVEDKKNKEVRKILAVYQELYDLQFKHQPVV